MKKNQSEPETREGRIRISNRERLRYQAHRKGLMTLLGVGGVLLFSLVLLLLMKNYTDRRIAQANDLLTKESNQYNELEKRIYERENFRAAYDLFAPNMVGIAAAPEDFSANLSKALSTGVIYGEGGFILAPADLLRGRDHVYVRLMTSDVEFIHEGYVLGIDEASGIGLIEAPAIQRELPVNLTPNKPSLAQTVLHIALPKGDADTGNLAMGEIHAAEELYTIGTPSGETKLSVLLTSSSIYFGNDGGAIVTMDGRLAGMASMALTRRLGVAPYTAVVPGSELEKIVDRLRKNEGPLSASFGVDGDIITIPDLEEIGFYVLEVEEGSTAQRGGIQPTDIILAVDGRVVSPGETIDSYLRGKKAGDEVTVSLLRLNETLSFVIKIY